MHPYPLSLFAEQSRADTAKQQEQFLEALANLYRFQVFKPLLDVIATELEAGDAKFQIKQIQLLDEDEGHCRTIEQSFYDKALNTLFRRHQHLIVIRRIFPDVIIHEIAHAIEKESGVDIYQEFMPALVKDTQEERSKNPVLLRTVKKVMLQEVAHYPPKNRASEAFARYFQLLAMARETTSSRNYTFTIPDLNAIFPHTSQWVNKTLYPILKGKANPKIAEASKSLLIDEKTLTNPNWEGRVKPFTKKDKSGWAGSTGSLFEE